MTRLREDRARILARLEAAQGAFVPGRELAKIAGIPFDWLGNEMKSIRRLRPDLIILSRRGLGYRIAAPEEVADKEVRPAAPRAESVRDAMRRGLAMLDLLPAWLAAEIKTVSLESGEPAQTTVERLLFYGLEVHRDLLLSGENPLALRRAA